MMSKAFRLARVSNYETEQQLLDKHKKIEEFLWKRGFSNPEKAGFYQRMLDTKLSEVAMGIRSIRKRNRAP